MHWSVHVEGGPRRVNHAALAVGSFIYSFGGYCTGDNYSVQRPIDVHILNSVTYRWRLLPARNDECTPFQRYGHTVVPFHHYVYLWGGRNDDRACRTLFRFDTSTFKWEKPAVDGNAPGARDGHSACVVREKMLIFGGYEEEVGLFSQDVYSLDLNTLTWTFVSTTGPAPTFRDFHTATVFQDRYMLIFGGRGDMHGPVHTRAEVYCNALVCLDVVRKEWIRPETNGELPSGRRSHSAFMHGDNMYIFGGYNGATDQHFNDFFRYDPENGLWTRVTPFGNGPAPRRRQGCVILDNRAFFFGGTSPSESVVVINYADDIMEESNLIDHDDLYVLDLAPTLKTLCLLSILANKPRIDVSGLPNNLKQELNRMTLRNQVSSAPFTASG